MNVNPDKNSFVAAQLRSIFWRAAAQNRCACIPFGLLAFACRSISAYIIRLMKARVDCCNQRGLHVYGRFGGVGCIGASAGVGCIGACIATIGIACCFSVSAMLMRSSVWRLSVPVGLIISAV